MFCGRGGDPYAPWRALACLAVDAQRIISIEITLDGALARCETRASSIGAYVLVLDTVLSDEGIELHSVYMGHPRVSTLVSHLMLAPAYHDTLLVEREHDQEYEHDTLPLGHARRRCLYDHLQRLQDFLGELGIGASIPVGDAALADIED